MQLNGREFYVAYTPVTTGESAELSTPGWSLASVVAAEDVLSSVAGLQARLNEITQQMLFARILPAGIVMALLVVLFAWWGVNRLVNPIVQLSKSAEKLGAGEWEAPLPMLKSVETNNDEIGLLARTMGVMARQLRQTFGQLEQRVAERTQALEYRTLQIQTAADAAREITAARDLDALLNGAVNLISERFGYYSVGIFLVDETSEFAHLKAASGELGRRLVQRDIRLRVGEQGMVGYVTRFGIARCSQDVSQDRLYWAEPLLPDTVAEATLPLRSADGKIIGALDVQLAHPQSGSPGGQVAELSEDDLTALQTLADQLATAIENVRLMEQLQSTLAETDRLFQQQARDAWRKMRIRAESIGKVQGAEYDRMEVRRLSGDTMATRRLAQTDAGTDDDATGAVLRVPVILRGQIIGYIGLESDDHHHEWSEDERAIVEATAAQAAQSVENARLLAESQQRATREKISAEVGARLQASLEPQVVLQNAVQEIALQLGIAEVSVELLPDTAQVGDSLLTGNSAVDPHLEIAGKNSTPDTSEYPTAHHAPGGANQADEMIATGHSAGGTHEPA